MNTVSRTISGSVVVIAGIAIVLASVAESANLWSVLWGVGSGLLLVGLGLYISFNTAEDTIEEITKEDK